jgi:F0F1-type ATP synthase membrane subunit c/vacuolar-type H+-ATPase subunit K
MGEQVTQGPLTVRSALWTLAIAAVFSIGFYYLVGFPANVPAAVGTSVLLAEGVEAVARRRDFSGTGFALAAYHAVLAAAASWLGVVVTRLLGWIG